MPRIAPLTVSRIDAKSSSVSSRGNGESLSIKLVSDLPSRRQKYKARVKRKTSMIPVGSPRATFPSQPANAPAMFFAAFPAFRRRLSTLM
jgi:hypothetical protein